ncbi:Smr/MutS family protein [candidate division KSB1 bacterium]
MEQFEDDEIFRLPITDVLDLHTFHPSETKDVTNEYLKECKKVGIMQVRIIHGKGKSVQKHIIHKLLKEHPLVKSYHDADPLSGGWGSTTVILENE